MAIMGGREAVGGGDTGHNTDTKKTGRKLITIDCVFAELCVCTYAHNKLVGVVRKTNMGTNTVYEHANIYTNAHTSFQ